jgi:hypothetical protein
LNKKRPLLKSVVQLSWINYQRRRKIQDAPLLIAQLEINISTMHYVTLEQVSVWCRLQSVTSLTTQY